MPPAHLGTGNLVVVIQQLAPGPVAHRRRALGGAHDIGEEHGGENSIGVLGRVQGADLLLGPSELLYVAAAR